METISKTIEHKPGKVESVITTDLQGNLIEGRTYKKYAPYLKMIESKPAAGKERWARNIPLCFKHEKKMLELVNSKGLPGVKLVREHPGLMLEVEYVAGDTLTHQLTSGITALDARRFITAAYTCIASHNNAGVVLIDTNPSNFLVSPQGQILFCDYGNATSIEVPFRCPPLATGNPEGRHFFSEDQNRAFKADHALDQQRRCAPYAPKQLRTNDLDSRGDIYVLANHILELCPQSLDKDLRALLEKIQQGAYQTADQVLEELKATAPKGFYTPEVEGPELTPASGSNVHIRSRRRSFSFSSWKMPRKAMAAAAALCLVSGLAVAEMQSGFLQGVINSKSLPVTSPVQQPPRSQAVQVSQAPAVQKSAAAPQVDDQKQQVKMLEKPTQPPQPEIKSEPASTVTKPAPEKQQIAASTGKVCKSVPPKKISALEMAKADAFSANTTAALQGIEALQQLAKHKAPVADQALETIGKLIERLENEAPSDAGRKRLELLCRYGHVRAHFTLAHWLESGKGIKGGHDLAAAYRHYVQAEQKISGASKALNRLESTADKTAEKLKKNPARTAKDVEELFQLLVAIAEKPENIQAQFSVGRSYAEGWWGQTRNMDLAATWLRRSLNNGYADAKTIMKQYGIKG